MNYREALFLAVSKQDISLNVNEIPFNVFLKNTGDVLTLCFLEDETSDYIVVAETNCLGREELRIIPKFNIEYISIFYDFEALEDKVEDKMFL